MKNIFFDLDGTLVDSSEGILNCFTVTFQAVNLPVPDGDTLKSFIGPPLESTFAQFGDASLVDKMLSIYRQLYRDRGVKQVRLYDGILDTLNTLKELNHKIYLATSKHQEMAIEMLTDLSILSASMVFMEL